MRVGDEVFYNSQKWKCYGVNYLTNTAYFSDLLGEFMCFNINSKSENFMSLYEKLNES